MITSLLLLTALTPTALPSTTAGARWGPEGHRIVALLAYPLLTPTARAKVNALLGGRSMADVANWADHIRRSRPGTAPLHFVNIPLGATSYDSARDCPGGACIIEAIAHDRRVLADSTASPVARVEALRFLIHFLGDLHQPLHCEDHGDRGGNAVHVTFFGRRTTLHHVWDSGLLSHAGIGQAGLVTELREEERAFDPARVDSGTVVEWAEQSHALAVQAYQLAARHRLGRAYERDEIGVVDQQLIRAAMRLAAVLNDTLR